MNKTDTVYNKEFYDASDSTTRRAAEKILPVVLDIFRPSNIVDFGCGEGMWLSVAKRIAPQTNICGVDGNYIDLDELRIEKNEFIPHDLTLPIQINNKFDLAISLEVGEHLENSSADVYVENITNHSDRVLFSAAIPRQGGTEHINEQWQSYWIKKFTRSGYYVSYAFRNYFWDDDNITPWRRQNLLFFSRDIYDIEKLKEFDHRISDVVHPQMYMIRTRCPLPQLSIKDIYVTIDEKIKELVNEGNSNFVIYPFGNHGYLCKEILNNKYRINEIAIVDNNRCNNDFRIISCKQLSEISEEYIVLENSGDIFVQMELMREIKKWVSKSRIVNIFNR